MSATIRNVYGRRVAYIERDGACLKVDLFDSELWARVREEATRYEAEARKAQEIAATLRAELAAQGQQS